MRVIVSIIPSIFMIFLSISLGSKLNLIESKFMQKLLTLILSVCLSVIIDSLKNLRVAPRTACLVTSKLLVRLFLLVVECI